MTLAASLTSALAIATASTFTATAYCLRGVTATGTPAGPGTVSVDPRVIRLGSRLWVSSYGYGRALDTGGAIRGRRLDLWFSSCSAALRFGVRRVTVRVLG